MMTQSEWVARERARYLQCYRSEPRVMVRGEGVFLYDLDGKRYLDFSAQYSAAILGHGHPEMLDHLERQARRLVGVSSMFITQERVELAERLAQVAPPGLARSLFGCTGSDANELALKVAKIVRGGGKIIGLWRAYHGATAGSAAATGKAETIQTTPAIYELLPPGFIHTSPAYCYRCDFQAAYPGCGLLCLEYLKRTAGQIGYENVAAIILEPIIAGGGVIVPPPGYLQELRAFCDRTGILLILDEVVTGMGRTGALFACQHEGIRPDVLVLGKGLTAGYIPGSAVLVSEEIGKKVDPFHLHGHTHSGYPLMAAAALKTLEILERDRLVEHAATMGKVLGAGLLELQKRHACVGDVRGRGLLWGIELVRPGSGGLPGRP